MIDKFRFLVFLSILFLVWITLLDEHPVVQKHRLRWRAQLINSSKFHVQIGTWAQTGRPRFEKEPSHALRLCNVATSDPICKELLCRLYKARDDFVDYFGVLHMCRIQNDDGEWVPFFARRRSLLRRPTKPQDCRTIDYIQQCSVNLKPMLLSNPVTDDVVAIASALCVAQNDLQPLKYFNKSCLDLTLHGDGSPLGHCQLPASATRFCHNFSTPLDDFSFAAERTVVSVMEQQEVLNWTQIQVDQFFSDDRTPLSYLFVHKLHFARQHDESGHVIKSVLPEASVVFSRLENTGLFDKDYLEWIEPKSILWSATACVAHNEASRDELVSALTWLTNDALGSGSTSNTLVADSGRVECFLVAAVSHYSRIPGVFKLTADARGTVCLESTSDDTCGTCNETAMFTRIIGSTVTSKDAPHATFEWMRAMPVVEHRMCGSISVRNEDDSD